jgi:molybdopterin synthase catalytic subunit
MRLSIRLFAAHRETAGRDTIDVDVPDGTSVAEIFARVCADYPAMATSGRSVAYAVNRVHVDGDACVNAGDEVAFLPPVAGG